MSQKELTTEQTESLLGLAASYRQMRGASLWDQVVRPQLADKVAPSKKKTIESKGKKLKKLLEQAHEEPLSKEQIAEMNGLEDAVKKLRSEVRNAENEAGCGPKQRSIARDTVNVLTATCDKFVKKADGKEITPQDPNKDPTLLAKVDDYRKARKLEKKQSA